MLKKKGKDLYEQRSIKNLKLLIISGSVRKKQTFKIFLARKVQIIFQFLVFLRQELIVQLNNICINKRIFYGCRVKTHY